MLQFSGYESTGTKNTYENSEACVENGILMKKMHFQIYQNNEFYSCLESLIMHVWPRFAWVCVWMCMCMCDLYEIKVQLNTIQFLKSLKELKS